MCQPPASKDTPPHKLNSHSTSNKVHSELAHNLVHHLEHTTSMYSYTTMPQHSFPSTRILPTLPRCRPLRCTAIATPTQSPPSSTIKNTRQPCHVRIGGEWKDLTSWVAAHPAGTHWLVDYHGRDATEVFYAFHSSDARATLARLPPLRDQAAVEQLDASAVACSRVQQEFRALRQQLEKDGWFERNALHEAFQLSTWALCLGTGLWMAHSGIPLAETLAFIPLGLSLLDSCWLAHDYIHGRGAWCSTMRNFGGWAAGFGATMWSNKHNMHHAATNEMGQDEDLSSGPLLWLWAPDPSKDKPWRRFQHLYVSILFSLLHVVWRVDSIKVVAGDRRLWVSEGLPMVVHYVLALTLLPWQTYVASILLGGFLCAQVVTCTHQSEDLLEGHQPDWVTAQFRTTRNAVTSNPLTEWFWGGMQYQLEHHLFPTLPRYKYRALVPVMQKWAKEQGLEHKSSSDWSMFTANYRNYARVAALDAVPGANLGKKGMTV